MQVEKPYFKRHLRLLTYLGVDLVPFPDDVWYKSYYRFYSFFIVNFMIVYAALEVADVLVTSDINQITFGLCYSATHVLGIVKMLVLIVKKDSIRKMMEKLESGNFQPNFNRGGLEEYRLVNAGITRSNYHMKLFHLMVNIIISGRALYALFDTGYHQEFDKNLNTTTVVHRRTLPFGLWLPIDIHIDKSPNFEIFFVFQVVSVLLYGYHIGLSDSLVYGMMIHMKTQYLFLQGVINKYVSSAKDLELDDVEGLETGYERVVVLPDPLQEKIKDIIVYCTKYHNEIFNFCEQIEEEFRYLMLMQFLFSLYILCFQLYQLSVSTSAFSFDFVSMCLYLMLMMYQLFCYCWYGNEVMLQSQMLAQDLYNSDWLVLNDSIRKSILLIMVRAQRPVQFTAGKFAFLSLQTFLTIIRGSASYFMVLRQMAR